MEESSAPRGKLKVTAPIPIGRRLVVPFIADFARLYPDIHIHLTLEDRFADIVGEGYDIAIRGAPNVDSTLTGRRLFETRRVIVASPAYLSRRGRPETLADLSRHDCLIFNKKSSFRERVALRPWSDRAQHPHLRPSRDHQFRTSTDLGAGRTRPVAEIVVGSGGSRLSGTPRHSTRGV